MPASTITSTGLLEVALRFLHLDESRIVCSSYQTSFLPVSHLPPLKECECVPNTSRLGTHRVKQSWTQECSGEIKAPQRQRHSVTQGMCGCGEQWAVQRRERCAGKRENTPSCSLRVKLRQSSHGQH